MKFTVGPAEVLVPLFLLYLAGLWVAVRRGAVPREPGRVALVTALAVYALGVVHFTQLPVDVDTTPYATLNPVESSLNLVPVLTADVTTFALNVVMLVPLGFLLPLLTARADSVPRACLWGAGVSLGIEAVQLLVTATLGSIRSVDVNDVIANTLGALAGYALLRAAVRVRLVRPPAPAPARLRPVPSGR